MTDLLDDFVRARVEPYRDLLWENGDISIAGLVLLDKCLKIDTYSRGNETANQCDGCMRGLSIRGGVHYQAQSSIPEMICTAERYTEASE